jgi:hypothetical protein
MKHLLSMGLLAWLAVISLGTAGSEPLEVTTPEVAIGHLLSVAGSVQGLTEGAVAEPLTQGEALETDMTITTGEDGQAVLQFQDGQMIALQANSSFQIHDYRYTPQNIKQSSVFFTLQKGGMRAINGVIANQHPAAFRIETDNATLRLDPANVLGSHPSDFMWVTQTKSYLKLNTGVLQVDNFAGAKMLLAGQVAAIASDQTLPVLLTERDLPPALFAKLQAIPMPVQSPSVVAEEPESLEPVGEIYNAAGVVEAAVGDTEAARRTQKKSVRKGVPLANKSFIFTSANSRAVLKFKDGQVVSLMPNSTFQIKNYRYNPTDPNKSNIALSILKGGMRAITGLIGHNRPAAFKLDARGTTIGIRGTDFMVTMEDSVYSHVATGAINLDNSAGTALLGAGETAVIHANNALPMQVTVDDLPAAVFADFTELINIPVPILAAPSTPFSTKKSTAPRPTAIDFCSNYGYAPGSADYAQCLDYAKTEGYL